MSTQELARRALRKYERSGVKSLWREGTYLLFESTPVRSVLSRRLLEANEIEPIGYEELLEIARSTGSYWHTFDDNDRIAEPIPSKTRIPASRAFEDLETHTPIPPAVMEFPDCTLVHPFGLTLCDRGVLQETIAKSTSSSSRVDKALSKSVADHGYREIDSIVSGTYSNSFESLSVATPLLLLWGNYYHWTIECLPRLAGIERYREVTGKEPTIIVPEDPSSWMLESLELLGYDDYRLYRLEDHCTVNRLIVPTHPGPTPVECEWLRDTMHTAVDGSSTIDETADHRIYISRRNATRRRVKNEAEVVETLRYHGFKSYALEELSVADQVTLFSNAEIVVSPHGAGLANIVYSDSTSIIELFGETKKTTFYRLAALLDHDYHSFHNRTKYGDIIVDAEQLEQHLDNILNS